MLQSKPTGLTQVHRDDPPPTLHAIPIPIPGHAASPASAAALRSDPERDEALLAAARSGDEAAFASIYDQWSGSIASYLYRLTGSREVADDLTQDTFLRAWRALGRVDPHLNLRPWLFRIATNLARSHHRRQRLRTWLPFTATTEPSVPDQVDQQLDAALLAQTLHAVGPTHRSVLLLRHHLHLPLDEVADALGISENTAKVRLYRARRAFVSAWHELSTDPAAAAAAAATTANSTTHRTDTSS